MAVIDGPTPQANVTRKSKDLRPIIDGMLRELQEELAYWNDWRSKAKEEFDKADEQVEIREALLKKMVDLRDFT